jgi:DNA-binding transcriptional MerR regulator
MRPTPSLRFLTLRPVGWLECPMHRLRYWEQAGLIVPSIKRRLSPHNTVRLYSFQDLLALLVVSELRTKRDMSLQRIRRRTY